METTYLMIALQIVILILLRQNQSKNISLTAPLQEIKKEKNADPATPSTYPKIRIHRYKKRLSATDEVAQKIIDKLKGNKDGIQEDKS